MIEQPGRVARRPAPALFSRLRGWAALLALGVGLAPSVGLGCAPPWLDEPPALSRALRAVWADYRELPAHKALAVAGELREGHWVAGASGGHSTRAEARYAALRECQRRRDERNMVEPCRLYAEGETLTTGVRG